jgi:hypothetical protein
MSAPQEQQPVNQDVVRLQAEAARMTGQELANELIRMAAKASEVKKAIDDSVKKNNKAEGALKGDKQDKGSEKGKASDVKESVQKVLLAVKSGKPITLDESAPIPANDFGQKTLKQLSEKIGDVDSISDETAPYLWSLMRGVLLGDIKDTNGLQQEFKKIENLKVASPDVFKKVQNAMVQTAKDSGNSEQEARQLFDVNDEQTIDGNKNSANLKDAFKSALSEHDLERAKLRNARDEEFESYWQHTFSDYFSNTEDKNGYGDKKLVKAIFYKDEFEKYVKYKKDNYRIAGDSEEDAGKKVSEDIKAELVELFGKLYTKLDHDNPDEFFEQIEQADVMRGIIPAKNMLLRRMTVLANELHKDHNDTLGLFRFVEERPEVMDTPSSSGLKPRSRIHAYPHQKTTSSSEYVHYLEQTVSTYIFTRKYSHNARAIFYHPVDHEKGFYSKLTQFAEQWGAADFDQMYLLPDAHIFQNAYQLYDKHVEEAFAKNGWRHSTTMFQRQLGEVRSRIEKDVFEQLRRMYDKDVSDARLEAAVTMGVGAARGMFLTEEEKAALADPHLTESGGFTYASYYTNDTAALTPFNPMHSFYRFQGLRSIDPILFLPVEGKGMDKHKSVFSDHKDLWRKMQGYKDSFIQGRGGPGSAINDGETLFADFMVNMGRVGGPVERKGWRATYTFENLYYYKDVHDEKGALKDKLTDYVHTWKRFENIGYEAVQDIVQKLNTDPGTLGTAREKFGNSTKETYYLEQKKELFQHIFDRYFKYDKTSLDGLLKDIRKTQEKAVWDDIKKGEKSPPASVEDEIEGLTTKEFMNRALARMVAQRIPSKILRMDRDRYNKDGKSRWRKIAEEMFPTGDKQSEQFDKVVRDLMFAEQMLRKEVSDQMRQMKKLPEDQQWQMGSINYELTQAKVRELLMKGGYSKNDIDQACILLGKIEDKYTHQAAFLDKDLLSIAKEGGGGDRENYRFSFGNEEFDMSFVPWRSAGNRLLARCVGDISTVEQTIAKEIVKLPSILYNMAIDGKGDFTPVLDMMQKMYGSMESIIGPDYAHRVVHHVAALTINYFKKDTRARWFYGLFGMGRKNSLAAERVGSGTRVWEWNSVTIDKFITAIETKGLLPLSPYNVTDSKGSLTPPNLPVYVNIPFINKPIKLPQKIGLFGKEIRLFNQRKKDFLWTGKRLRDEFGGNWKDIAFDMLNKYLPLVIAWLLWQYIKKAQDEAEGKKK